MSLPLGRDDLPRRLYILAAICGACFVLACGVQGPPRPPRIEHPQKITDVAVTQVGRALEIQFTLPTLATDGERLTKPLEIEIFRAVTPAGQPSPAVATETKPWATLFATDLSRYAKNSKMTYPDRLSDAEFAQNQGAMFTYRLRALTRGFRRHPRVGEISNAAEITILNVLPPVRNLTVKSTETALELRWDPPESPAAGGAIQSPAGYRVYRSKAENPSAFLIIGETATATYLDREFLFDHAYSYKVRAIVRQGGQTAESEDSAVVSITPHDTFPPASPSGLTALYTGQAIELVWDANSEPELSGYNVYRHEQGQPAQRVNAELLRTPLFRDLSAEQGRTYFYAVTAVDLAGNESPQSEEVSVETR